MTGDAQLTSLSDAQALDAADPLFGYRDQFVGVGSDAPGTPQAYFDGNSLGRPLKASIERVTHFIQNDWGTRLIRSWDEQWLELPHRIGDALAQAALGAAPGQTIIGDSTTVMLYKFIRAAVSYQLERDPNRTELVIDDDNFPTDRYIVEGIANELGLTVRWVAVDRALGVTLDLLQPVLGPKTNTVVISHVAYRSGYLADMAGLTRAIHDAGGVVLWDLCHSAGSVAVELDACNADLAVGCTYKYINGGPGAPAFGYVRADLQEQMTQPIQGWIGHADPFAMGPGYTPGPGMRRFISGTVPVTGMLAMQDTIGLIAEVGIDAIREKSLALTEYAIGLADAWLAPLGVELATPRDGRWRGGHVTLSHPAMREVNQRLWAEDVIPDYRDPHGLRIGLSPLSTSFQEVWLGMSRVRDTLRTVLELD
ncbi:MAG: kynureninase [Microbacteriaceae bacterium]